MLEFYVEKNPCGLGLSAHQNHDATAPRRRISKARMLRAFMGFLEGGKNEQNIPALASDTIALNFLHATHILHYRHIPSDKVTYVNCIPPL
jgi:hypothetical protein